MLRRTTFCNYNENNMGDGGRGGEAGGDKINWPASLDPRPMFGTPRYTDMRRFTTSIRSYVLRNASLGDFVVQHVTVLNTVGNCNTIYYIILYHILYYIISYHILYYIILYYIILYYIILYYIILYYIILYYIILYYI